MPTVLITGASMGLGAEFARIAAEEGDTVILTARSLDRLEVLSSELQERFSCTVHVVPLDLAQPGAAIALFEEVRQSGLSVDVLVNNAGFGLQGPFLEHRVDDERRLLELNVQALTELCHLYGAEMVERGSGQIMNVASIAAFQAGPYLASYYASKAYVLSFSEALAHELRSQGVSVTALCPGPTRTEFFRNAGMTGTSLSRSPVMMSAAEVAQCGWRGMQQGKQVVITGRLNQLLAFSTRLSPRRWTSAISGFLNRG
ncbi:MAG: SDR family NAD(P)-dependent oxidoreductase [bacterium]|jgi:short-subunit dehydrogenase